MLSCLYEIRDFAVFVKLIHEKRSFFVNQGGRVSSDVGKPLANIFETLALYCPTQQFCYSLNFYILWLKIFFLYCPYQQICYNL